MPVSKEIVSSVFVNLPCKCSLKGARTYCIINKATLSATVAMNYNVFLLAKSSFKRAFSPTTLSSLHVGTATVQKN